MFAPVRVCLCWFEHYLKHSKIDVPNPTPPSHDTKGAWLDDEWKRREIAMTAWAFANLGIIGDNFFFYIDQRGEWLVKAGKSQ